MLQRELLVRDCRVVLLDIDMPQINGLEALREIKQHDGGIQVIMLTGLVSMNTVLESMRLGAESCLFKPVTDVAPLLDAIEAAWTGAIWLVAGAVLLAALYLYCQARILKASKGIPAWREPAIVPLMIATGLAEGAGLAIVALAATGNLASRWLVAALVVVLIVRDLMWRHYRRALAGSGAPKGTLQVLAGINLVFSLAGNWGPVVLLLAAIPEHGAANVLALVAGIAAVGAGWLLKFTIVARAAFNQGFALPALPIRGSGARVAGTKPGWEKPAQG
jgi:phenylacetyl-CoA:acceptor oxidoreductase subunit 2